MLRRRELLLSTLAALPLVARSQEPGAARRAAAFEAKTLAELTKALGLSAPVPSSEVTVKGPDLHEDGAVVPLSMTCSAAGVRRMLLCVERNPFLLSAVFEPGAAVEANFGTRVKMQQTSMVQALAVLADGRVLSASKEVKITLGGCGGAADAVPEPPGQPTLIRMQPTAGAATVRALMKHEMESGQRKDDTGRIAPAWYIEDVVARLNGQLVLTAQWGTSISKNPFLQFVVKGARPGDRMALAWVDNRGNRRSDEATLGAAAPA